MSEQNPHLQWRLAFAAQSAARIRAVADVRAIVVAGSVARGYADAYSDLELALFWDAPPGEETRLALVAALDADFTYQYDRPVEEDELLVNGFKVDIWQNTVAQEEAVFRAVLEEYSTDLSASNFMDTVRACIPLHGHDLIRDWKQRAAAYPAELAARNIREQLARFYAGQLHIFARRQNPTAFYADVLRRQEAAFLVLLALNRRYFPTYKWIAQTLAEMPVKPTNAAARFRQAFSDPQPEAAVGTTQLLHDTLDLVEQHFPQIDTRGARERLTVRRQAHHSPVPFPS